MIRKTPYVPHLFGDAARERINRHQGYVSGSVMSSIPWSQEDVWIEYDGYEYFLHGMKPSKQKDEYCSAPGISTPSKQEDSDDAMKRLYKLTSIMGFFKRGYVDITYQPTWGTSIYRTVNSKGYSQLTQAGPNGFSCNHMPIIEDESTRIALAFFREGCRLSNVHNAYAFLSFFKVLESQMDSKQREQWFEDKLEELTDKRAAKRIDELRAQNIDVNKHLFDSCRCAIAHANINKKIIDPDIPDDKRRITEDLCIIEALAKHYIKTVLEVPDVMNVYSDRDRLTPLYSLMTPEVVETLKAGGNVSAAQLGQLQKAIISVNLWSQQPVEQFQKMILLAEEGRDGIIKLLALSSRGTIRLVFAMNIVNGKMHTLLEESDLLVERGITEQDVEEYARYFYSAYSNGIVECRIQGTMEPVDCEVIIPVNRIIKGTQEEVVKQMVDKFKRGQLSSR